jgi:small subunit ribosomal protein S20
MANIRSQEKRNNRSERERLENRRRTSTVKTYFRRLEEALGSNDDARVEAEYKALVSRIDKAAEHGALHRNNAARKKSRAARLLARRSG